MTRKYRVLELENRFFPQEKRWFWWVYLDNMVTSITWSEESRHYSECWNLSDAKDVIRKRKLWLRIKYGKPIIHNYN